MTNKIFILILFVIGFALITKAQTGEAINEGISDDELVRTLAGHRFVSNSFIQSPFIDTYLEISVGAGKTGVLETPPIVINGEEYVFKIGDMAFSYLYCEYQQAVKDWIAFSANATLIGRLGVDMRSLLTQGVSLGVGFEFGWLLKIYKRDNQLLSGSINVSNNDFTLVDLYGFSEEIIDSGRITPDNKLVDTTPSTSTTGGLSYAYAISEMFGITAIANIGYGESPERISDNEFFFSYGAAIDADLSIKYSVPFSVALSYFGVVRDDNTSTIFGNPQNILFQINYNDKKDLDLGLVLEYQWFKDVSLEQTISFTNIYLDLKYFFL